MKLEENIYRLRAERSMSQEELADLLGVSRQSVSKWETGTSVPDLERLMKMCDIFNISLDELTGRVEPAAMTGSNVSNVSAGASASAGNADSIVESAAQVYTESATSRVLDKTPRPANSHAGEPRPPMRTQFIVGIALLALSLVIILVPVILLIPQASDDVSYDFVNKTELLDFILLYFILPICLTCAVVCLTAKSAAPIKCLVAVMIVAAFLSAFLPIFRSLMP